MRPTLMFAMPISMTTSLALAVDCCATGAKLLVNDGMGINPRLPEPNTLLPPTVKVAKAAGWSGGV